MDPHAAGAGPGHKEDDVFCIMLSLPFGKKVELPYRALLLKASISSGASAQHRESVTSCSVITLTLVYMVPKGW